MPSRFFGLYEYLHREASNQFMKDRQGQTPFRHMSMVQASPSPQGEVIVPSSDGPEAPLCAQEQTVGHKMAAAHQTSRKASTRGSLALVQYG